jgi:gluconolactonase
MRWPAPARFCVLLLLCAACSGAAGGKHAHVAADGGGSGDAAVRDASHMLDASANRDASAPHDTGVGSDAATSHDAQADAAADGGSTLLRGVCDPNASYAAALSSKMLSAAKVTGDFTFTEGPVWIASQGVLLFSDISPGAGTENVQPSKIRRLTPPSTFDLWLDNSGSNGMALSVDGKQLIACTHDTQSVSSYTLATKQRGTVTADYQGKTFHSPNDVTVRSDGTVYFTDPNFQQGNRNSNIVDKTRVYRVPPGGVAIMVDESIDNPNGIALSPDEKTLYVDGSSAGDGKVWKYSVESHGVPGTPQVFAQGLQAPDGMAVDCAGNLYVAEFNTGLLHVYAAKDGAELGTITASTHTTNAAFGGTDKKTLFITSGGAGGSNIYGLYSIKLGVPGLPY